MTKLEKVLSDFSENPYYKNLDDGKTVGEHLNIASEMKTRDGFKEYALKKDIWKYPFVQGAYEGMEHVKPQTYKEYRSKTAKNAATVREENKLYGKEPKSKSKY